MAPISLLHVTAVEFSVRTLLYPQLMAFKGLGYDVRVATMSEGETFSPALAPFDPIKIAFPRSINAAAAALATWKLMRVVRRMRPDVLHVHSPSIALPVRLVPHSALPPNTRLVHTVHGFPHQWDQPMPLRDRCFERVEWALSGRADALLFQSLEDYDQARARNYRSNLAYIGNGVQDRWFDVALPQRDGDLRLLFVGRLVEDKGLLVLLDAIAQVPNVRLTIAGGQARGERDGVEDRLSERIERYGLGGRVRRLGLVPPDKLPEVMAEHDALVLPTFHPEGVPRSIIEAAAAGRPVVTTFVRGCREVVRDGVNGYIVPRRSVSELAAAIIKLDRLEPDRFHEMAVAARRTAELNHRESRVIERLLENYAKLGVGPDEARLRSNGMVDR